MKTLYDPKIVENMLKYVLKNLYKLIQKYRTNTHIVFRIIKIFSKMQSKIFKDNSLKLIFLSKLSNFAFLLILIVSRKRL